MFTGRLHSSTAVILGAMCLAACGGSNGPTDLPPLDHPLTISGSIIDRSGDPIPAGVRVIGVWFVASGTPDYEFIFGEGSIDPSRTSFSLTFDRNPPSEALNDDGLGVGYITLVNDSSLHQGDRLPADFKPEESIVGGSERYVVIYVRDKQVAHGFPWVSSFESGYSVGLVTEEPEEYFVGFTPTASDGITASFDDWKNMKFPDWT